MNNKKPANPYAFPCDFGDGYQIQNGMDLRDYFAAKAMQTMLKVEVMTYEDVAKTAYDIADEMLKARG